jgi:hypothetical protein
MYRPNFCAECGAQIVRESWHLWTNRRFCERCAPRLRRRLWVAPLLAGGALLGFGLAAGRWSQPAAPPLAEQRAAAPFVAAAPTPGIAPLPAATPEAVSICGARTKKGAPCSRRVRGTGRCFQHLGQPAMLPPERLIVQR